MFNKELSDITANDLSGIIQINVKEKFVDVLKKDGYSNSSIKNTLAGVKSFLKSLSINRVFEGVNYDFILQEALNVKYLRDDTKKTQNMTESQVEEFKDWLNDENNSFFKRDKKKNRLYAIVVGFMFSTGMRVDETFKIKWNDIKIKYDSYGASAWCIVSKGKRDKIAERYISDELYMLLKDEFWFNYSSDTDLVFDGLYKQTFQNLMKEFSREKGYELSPHSLRVGAATKLYRETNDIVLVTNFMNHDDPKTTMGYIRQGSLLDNGSYILSSNIQSDDINKLDVADIMDILNKRKDLATAILLENMRGRKDVS